jgi:hypothetical protein
MRVIFFLANNLFTLQSIKQSGGPIQLRVGVYRSGECDMLGIMTCSSASTGAGMCAKHTIIEGGLQIHHCANQGSGTPRT